jgi:hypothetical protein
VRQVLDLADLQKGDMIVNINGSSKKALYKERRAVLNSLRETLGLLRASTPHGRDYQLESPQEYLNALADHTHRVDVLLALSEELHAELVTLWHKGKIDNSSVRYSPDTGS